MNDRDMQLVIAKVAEAAGVETAAVELGYGCPDGEGVWNVSIQELRAG